MNDKWFLGARRVFFALFACWVTLPAFATHRALVEETADAVKVGNGSVELIVPKGKAFNIQSMKLNDGEEMVVPSTNAIPWVLTYKGIQGENPMLFPEHGVYKGYEVIQNDTSASVVFVWDMRLSYEKRMYPIRMKVTATDHSELLYWDLTADLPKGWVISKAQFPRIAVVRPKDGKMITSAGWGNEFDMATGGAYKVTYPSCTGSMQLLLMHNGEGSFYYATEDRNACGKELRAVCGSKSVTFVTEVVTSEGWTDATTGRFDLPWTTVVGYNPDGWQAAALQWYRPFTFTCEWGNKSLQSHNIPQWLLDKDLWIRSKGVTDTVMAAINKTIDFFGEGIGVHTYYWHNYPYDTHYPDYFPAKPEFEGMISTIQKRKCHAVPYINGRLWDPAADSYTALNGASASCRKADGTLYTEIYPTSKVLNTVTCPASSLWHKIIIGLVDKIQNELHTNGVYIDQIAAAAPQPCFAKNHGHAAGGGDFWYKSYKAEDFFIRLFYIQSRRNHPPVISQTRIFIAAVVSGSLNIFIYRAICLTCKNLALPCTVIVRRGNNLVSPTRAQLIDRRILSLDIVELINRIFHNNRRSTRVSSLTSIATRTGQILVFTVRTSGESCNCHSCHKNPCKFSHLFHIKIYLGLKILLRFMQK